MSSGPKGPRYSEDDEHDSDWEPSDDYYADHADEFVDGYDPDDDFAYDSDNY